jgi:hypothetical protein
MIHTPLDFTREPLRKLPNLLVDYFTSPLQIICGHCITKRDFQDVLTYCTVLRAES